MLLRYGGRTIAYNAQIYTKLSQMNKFFIWLSFHQIRLDFF